MTRPNLAFFVAVTSVFCTSRIYLQTSLTCEKCHSHDTICVFCWTPLHRVRQALRASEDPTELSGIFPKRDVSSVKQV